MPQYPIVDSLQNLRIHVRLERVASAAAGASGAANFQAFIRQQTHERTPSASQLLNDDVEPTGGTSEDVDEYTFRWQEKLFSHAEYERYARVENCHTDLQHQYNRKVIELQNAGGRPTKRLFTYVDGDDYVELEKSLIRSVATRAQSTTPDAVSETITQMRRRKIVPQGRIAAARPVNEMPPKHTPSTMRSVVRTMHIMADTGALDGTPDAATRLSAEVRLCTISIVDDQYMLVEPDFTPTVSQGTLAMRHAPYAVDGRLGVFHFTLTDVTPKPSTISKSAIDLHEEQVGMLKAQLFGARGLDELTAQFDVPEPSVLRVLLLGEIVGAKSFEYDNLSIHYLINLPKGWYSTDRKRLEGVTPFCQAATDINQEAYQHYGYIFEQVLCFNELALHDESMVDQLPSWPQLYLCITSLSSLDVHRTEGYAAVALPTQPGFYDFEVRTWRPTEFRFDELRRFFVGGSPELSSLSCAGASPGQQGTHTSKLGLLTVASGTVRLRFRVAFQCRAYMSEERQRQVKYGAVIERLGSILAVLEAFQRARRRMLDARDNLNISNELVENLAL